MTIKTTLRSVISAAALTLIVAAQAEAETEFSTLAGIEAEPMNAAEMEAIQGKAFLGASFDGQYVLWYFSELTDAFGSPYPFAWDPNVAHPVIAGVQAGVLPLDPYVLVHQIAAWDPQAWLRYSPLGRMTANGTPCIRGFTVGC